MLNDHPIITAVCCVVFIIICVLIKLLFQIRSRCNFYQNQFYKAKDDFDKITAKYDEVEKNFRTISEQYNDTKAKYEEAKQKYDTIYEKYKDVVDMDSYKDHVTSELEDLKSAYSEKHVYYEKLLETINLYEERIDMAGYGLYQPHFSFDTSERYKIELQRLRDEEKLCIKNEKAVVCYTDWTINGNKTEGKKQTQRYIKLMLRAFNGECEAMVSDVRWNNVNQMEERMQKAFEAINKLGEIYTISITTEYKYMKLKELFLTYEYQEKLHQEKEEQRLIKERMREEEKVQREIEQKEKEMERQRKEAALLEQKLQEAIAQAKQEEAEKYQAQISVLEQQIEDNQRAVSQAQLTKFGYVYIISNIGSFGENIYKIGMTRRLNPKERVDELGSASVPFEFDIHAMIKSENAPELETNLHKYFFDKRVNLINPRKEFFKISLNEIEEYAKQHNINVEFTKIAEAREFRETEAMRKAYNKQTAKDPYLPLDFPDSI